MSGIKHTENVVHLTGVVCKLLTKAQILIA